MQATYRDDRRTEEAFGRSTVYKYLSSCFLHPNNDLCRFLNDGGFVAGIEAAATSLPLKNDLPSSARRVAGRLFEPEAMRDEYIRLFTLKSGAPPYENDYHGEPVFIFSTEPMADIAAFYRAFGIGFSGERPDHIGAELEFMHIAALKEAEAVAQGLAEEADLCRSIQSKFLMDHLGRWTDAFVEALQAEGGDFYEPIVLLLKEWVDLECTYFKVAPEKLKEPFVEELDALGTDDSICPGGCRDE